MTKRDQEFMSLQEEYADLLGHVWKGNKMYGCYEIIRKYYKWKYDYEMIDFNGRRKLTLFTEDAIKEQGGKWVYRSEWGDSEIDLSELQQDDVLVFRLYTTALDGSYSVSSRHNLPNHGGVYLGNGFMLHHPYKHHSMIVDLQNETNSVYLMSCVGALRSGENLDNAT